MPPDFDPAAEPAGPRIRIGELSRRTGIGVDTLRAWERRYSVLEPVRSHGGFRLYGLEDEARARRMSELIAGGHSASEAARAVRTPGRGGVPGVPDGAGPSIPAGEEVEPLVAALAALDEAAAHAVLDRVFAALSLETACATVVLPALREIGRRWDAGDAGIAEEHFASNLIRARLLALSRGWGGGGDRHAILACPSGEQHDLGLIVFGLVLRAWGWRITYLGPDTPAETIADAAVRIRPDAVILSALAPDPVNADADQLRDLARQHRLVLAGPDEVTALAAGLGAERLAAGPVDGALELDAA